ncbi:netrin receptor unc-5, partial [Anoplophora glabripennis]
MAAHPQLSLTLLISAFFLSVVRCNQDGGLLDDASTTKPTPEQDESLLLNTDLPIFLAEPQNAFVVKNRPAILHCRAAHALKVYFKCNGARKVETIENWFVDPQTGVRIFEADTNVTRDMVEEFFGKEKFKCECYAWNGRGNIKSQPATVEVA